MQAQQRGVCRIKQFKMQNFLSALLGIIYLLNLKHGPLTVISFSLLSVGSRNTQNPVNGVGSRRVVGGAGYRWGNCVWYCGKGRKKIH